MTKIFEYKVVLVENLMKIGNDTPIGSKDLSGKFKLDPFQDALDSLGLKGWELCSIWGTDKNSHFIFKRETK